MMWHSTLSVLAKWKAWWPMTRNTEVFADSLSRWLKRGYNWNNISAVGFSLPQLTHNHRSSNCFCSSCVAELKCSLMVIPDAMIWCLLLHISLDFIISRNSQEVWAGVSCPNNGSTSLIFIYFFFTFLKSFYAPSDTLALTLKFSILECQPHPVHASAVPHLLMCVLVA